MRALAAFLLLMLTTACAGGAQQAVPPPPPPPPVVAPPPPPAPLPETAQPDACGFSPTGQRYLRDSQGNCLFPVQGGHSVEPEPVMVGGAVAQPVLRAAASPRQYASRSIALPLQSTSMVYMTDSGTLTTRALAAIIRQCAARGIPLSECMDEINAGAPPFDELPREARDEAVLLLRACRGMPRNGDCEALVHRKRSLRDLPLGLLRPEPRTMEEGEETVFTAFIRRTALARLPGEEAPVNERGEPVPEASAGAGAPLEGTVVEYSQDMCFLLEARPRDFRIVSEAEQCPRYLQSGQVAFAPQWQVVPLRGGSLPLRLTRILRLGADEEKVPQEPYPVLIEVMPKPTLPQRIVAWLTAWTGVADAARGFVLAVEGLIVAIGGLSIWKLLRRRRRISGEAPEPVRPAASPPP